MNHDTGLELPEETPLGSYTTLHARTLVRRSEEQAQVAHTRPRTHVEQLGKRPPGLDVRGI